MYRDRIVPFWTNKRVTIAEFEYEFQSKDTDKDHYGLWIIGLNILLNFDMVTVDSFYVEAVPEAIVLKAYNADFTMTGKGLLHQHRSKGDGKRLSNDAKMGVGIFNLRSYVRVRIISSLTKTK